MTHAAFKPYHDPSHLYFITATLLGWHPLFADPVYARIVLDSLDWHRRNQRWFLYAYALMPNHLHAILMPSEDTTISAVLQSFGSYTAHAVLARLQLDGRSDLLTHFARRQARDAGKRHQIWYPIQAKNIHSPAFLRQKLDYIHSNPLAKHWRLAHDRADYVYSSACYYDSGATPIVEIDDVGEWLI
jgi:REP element-mobilizing transposase RayT